MSAEEPRIIESLANLCKELGVTMLVQVGAQDGTEAYLIQKATGCRVMAIEALDTANPIPGLTDWAVKVIGASNSLMPFYIHESPDLSVHIKRGDGKERRELLPQERLDSFCLRHGIVPDALIIDTEGTTMEVLEGCDALLDGMKVVYAECQRSAIRPGIRTLDEVNRFLVEHGMVMRPGLPAYGEDVEQGNYCWVRV